MNLCNKTEMAERFRLYGEILMLCADLVGEEEVYNNTFDFDELAEDKDIERFDVEEDDGSSGAFDGIFFAEGMLLVNYGVFSVPFFNVTSGSLQNILELLQNYKSENYDV